MFFDCSPARAHAATVSGRTKRGASKHFTVDIHCHVETPEASALVEGVPHAPEPGVKFANAATREVNRKQQETIRAQITSVETRLKIMDRSGIDIQAISTSPMQYYYWAEPDLAQEIVRLQNEALAELCAQHPKRLAGLGTVSLQHPDLAAEQLRTAVTKLGLRGIQISTSINGRELSDPSLAPVWRVLEELQALCFIHPFGSSLGARANAYYLVNTIGQPLETTIALSHLIFSGVLDRHPGLKILAAHGGGYLPTYIGRSDRAYAVRPEAAVHTQCAPSAHLKRIWYDTVVYDPMSLRHLIDRVGMHQIVLGSDYPFDMGCYNVHELVAQTPGLTEEERAAVLGRNAAALIGWPLAE